jgi:hypothetical protein
MADLHMDNTRAVDMREFNELHDMMHDSMISGPIQLRQQHLLFDQMVAYRGEVPFTEYAMNIIKTRWSLFQTQMDRYFCAFGFVIMTVKFDKVPVDSKARQQYYGEFYDPKQKVGLVPVPIIPVRGSFVLKQRMVDWDQEMFVEDLDGKERKDVFIIQSCQSELPDYLTGKFRSRLSALLPEYRELKDLEKLRRQVIISNALPPILVQRQQRSDQQHLTELSIADLRNRGGVYVDDNGFTVAEDPSGEPQTQVSETADLGALSKEIIERGTTVNRSLLTHRVQDGFQVSAHTPEAKFPIDYQQERRHFEQQVCVIILGVPLEYVQGDASGGSGALIQNESSVDKAKDRLLDHISRVSQDLELAMEQVWLRFYGEEEAQIRFHIPTPTNVDIDTILKLHDYNVLPAPLAIEEVMKRTNIDRKRMLEHVDPETHKLNRFELTVEEQRLAKRKNRKKKKDGPAKKKTNS